VECCYVFDIGAGQTKGVWSCSIIWGTLGEI